MSSILSGWIGRVEEVAETITPAQALRAAAMLGHLGPPLERGNPLPPLWHWFYLVPWVAGSQLGSDGHPLRGNFMPPAPQPRRMYAGGRFQFHEPLILGAEAVRRSEILNVAEKSGRSGSLTFVTVAHRIIQDGTVKLEEEQDIVYREEGSPVPAPTPVDLPPAPSGSWSRVVTPDPVLLFRFSALTCNGHRIHYDRDYARSVEGYPGLIVHGPLTALLLLELARGRTSRPIRTYGFRSLAPIFDKAPFRLVATPDGDLVRMEAQGPDGRPALSAEATLG